MKKQLRTVVTLAFMTLAATSVNAQTNSDLVGYWFLESVTETDVEDYILEIRENRGSLEISEPYSSQTEYQPLSFSGNQLRFDRVCRGYCHLEGTVSSDRNTMTLEWIKAAGLNGRDGIYSQETYEMTRLQDYEYCAATGSWEYQSTEDFAYSPNSGFAPGGPPYQAPVEITEDQNGNITISGFYNMSTGSGTGGRRVHTIQVEMPLMGNSSGELYGLISPDGQRIEGGIYLSSPTLSGSTTVNYTMTRKTECGEASDSDSSDGDPLQSVLDLFF